MILSREKVLYTRILSVAAVKFDLGSLSWLGLLGLRQTRVNSRTSINLIIEPSFCELCEIPVSLTPLDLSLAMVYGPQPRPAVKRCYHAIPTVANAKTLPRPRISPFRASSPPSV